MEKRAEPRFEAEQIVRVTTLGEHAEEFLAQILNVSGTGMRLLVDRLVPAGMPLKIEWNQILLLGDVCYCQPAERGFAIGLELEHALLHTGELARLAQALLGEALPSRAGDSQAVPVRKRPDR
jgi:hypothetical protein